MTFREYAEKIETLKYLAQHKRAGSPQYLAVKFNVSKRTIQRMIQHLRDDGCPIVFNRQRNTYEMDT